MFHSFPRRHPMSVLLRSLQVSALFLVVFAVGCGPGQESLYQARGRVIRGDQGLPKAEVTFHPSAGSKLKDPTTVRTNKDGYFMITQGIPPGQYPISIVCKKKPKQKKKDKADSG